MSVDEGCSLGILPSFFSLLLNWMIVVKSSGKELQEFAVERHLNAWNGEYQGDLESDTYNICYTPYRCLLSLVVLCASGIE